MISARLAARTKVLRSTLSGRNAARRLLKAGRAITECWTPNNAIKAKLMSTAAPVAVGTPSSIPFGTMKLARKAMRYRNVTKRGSRSSLDGLFPARTARKLPQTGLSVLGKARESPNSR
jgi:hypothetical protein